MIKMRYYTWQQSKTTYWNVITVYLLLVVLWCKYVACTSVCMCVYVNVYVLLFCY